MAIRNIITKRIRFALFCSRFLFVCVLLFISYLAFTPLGHPVVTSINDKLNHLAAFWTLGLLIDYSFPRSSYSLQKILILLSYGIGIELIQAYLPHRSFSLLDIIADLAGILIFGACIPIIKKIPLANYRWQVFNPLSRSEI